MSDLQSIADRVDIEALRGEFTDAVMMHDYDRFASLFTHDGAVRDDVPAGAMIGLPVRAGTIEGRAPSSLTWRRPILRRATSWSRPIRTIPAGRSCSSRSRAW
jgi:hypothetical protein